MPLIIRYKFVSLYCSVFIPNLEILDFTSFICQDSSIIISTHLVNDVENIFDDVCFIGKGKIILNGSAEDLRLEKGVSIDKLYIQTFMNE